MVDTILHTVQQHSFLTLVLIGAGFIGGTIIYQWISGASANRRKNAKTYRDGLAKLKSDQRKKRQKQISFWLRWILSIGFLAVILFFALAYIRPF